MSPQRRMQRTVGGIDSSTGLESACGSALEDCDGERTCDITECTDDVGVFQYACLRPAGLGGYGSVTAAFYDSMRSGPKNIVCPVNTIGICE